MLLEPLDLQDLMVLLVQPVHLVLESLVQLDHLEQLDYQGHLDP